MHLISHALQKCLLLTFLCLFSSGSIKAQCSISLDSAYCINDAPTPITLPNDVSISGPGIVQSFFAPAIAGQGTHTLIASKYDVIKNDSFFAPLTGSGTNLFLGQDDTSSALPLGFTFDFYCNSYTTIQASSNGFLTFTQGQPLNTGNQQFLPTSTPVNNLIAHYWRDLNPSIGGANINYYTTGTAPFRKFVYNFNDVKNFGGQLPVVKQQVILFETTNTIEIHTTYSTNNTTTMGIENIGGTVGHPVPGRNNMAWISSSDFVRFIPCCDIKQIDVNGGLFTLSADSITCYDDHDGTITATVIGGTQPYTYLWNDLNNQTTNPAVNLSGGFYTLELTDATGCVTKDSAIIHSEHQLQANFSFVHNQCSGDDTGSIAASVGGGLGNYTFLWNDPLGQVTSTASNLIGGDYTLTVTDASGCDSVWTRTVLDLKNRIPLNLGNDTTICIGTPHHIIADSGFMSYVWQNGIIGQNFVVGQAGIYSVTATQWNGCISSDSIFITTQEPDPPVKLPKDTAINQEFANPFVLTAPAGFASYLWSPGGETTQSIDIFSSGYYRVDVTDSKGCPSFDDINIDIWPVGIEETSERTFNIYPNPNNGQFYISSQHETHNASLIIRDLRGVIVYSQQINFNESSTEEISILHLAKGTYLVQIKGEKKTQTYKMVITK